MSRSVQLLRHKYQNLLGRRRPVYLLSLLIFFPCLRYRSFLAEIQSLCAM